MQTIYTDFIWNAQKKLLKFRTKKKKKKKKKTQISYYMGYEESLSGGQNRKFKIFLNFFSIIQGEVIVNNLQFRRDKCLISI